VEKDETFGHFLQAGPMVLAPRAYDEHPVGTVLRIESELQADFPLFYEPPDPFRRRWIVRQSFVRRVRAVSDGDVRSLRPDWAVPARFRQTDQMSMWEEEWQPWGNGRELSDYVLELEAR
jgi:hypothetical protein